MPDMTAEDFLGLSRSDAPPPEKTAQPSAAAFLGLAEPSPEVEEKPKVKDTGLLAAPLEGAMAGLRGFGKGAQMAGSAMGISQAPTVDEPNSLAAQPLEWGDALHPKAAAEKILYGLGEGAPEIVGGIAGGIAGGGIGSAIPGAGTTVGGLAGGALGAGAMNMAKTIGPYYAAALKETPDDPRGAFTRAAEHAALSGAISSAGWAAFGVAPFKAAVEKTLMKAFGVEAAGKPLVDAMTTGLVKDPAALAKAQAAQKWAGAKDIATQALAVQPAVAASGKVLENIAEGKPAGEDVGASIPGAIAGTAVPAAGHAVLRTAARRLGNIPEKVEPGSERPTAVPADQVPKVGDVLGLKFPDAPTRRAKVDKLFDDGQSVRLRFDDDTTQDYNTADVLGDRAAAPPPLEPDDVPPPMSQETGRTGTPVSQQESFDIQEAATAREVPRDTKPRAGATGQLKLGTQDLRMASSLRQRVAEDEIANKLSDEEKTDMLQEALRLEARSRERTPPPENTEDSNRRTEAARQAALMGPLGRAAPRERPEPPAPPDRAPPAAEPEPVQERERAKIPPAPEPVDEEPVSEAEPPPSAEDAEAEAQRTAAIKRSAAARQGVATKRAQNDNPDLFQFIAALGGITPEDPNIGDLRRVLGRSQVPVQNYGFLINRKGVTLDQAREAAEEAGYIGKDANSSQRGTQYQETGADDLLDAIARHNSGKKVYPGWAETLVQDRAASAAADVEQERQAETLAAVQDQVRRIGATLSTAEIDEAGTLVRGGQDPAEAVYDVLERAQLAQEEEAADNAERTEGIDDGFKRKTTVDPELAPAPRAAAEVPRPPAAGAERDAEAGAAPGGGERGSPAPPPEKTGPPDPQAEAEVKPEGLAEPPPEERPELSPEYEAALEASGEAGRMFAEAQRRYRARAIDDATFLRASDAAKEAHRAFDAAYAREESRLEAERAKPKTEPKTEKLRNVVGATDQFVLPGTEHKPAEAAAVKRGTDKERAELGMQGKKAATKPQAGAEDLPLFGLREEGASAGVRLTPAERAYFGEILGNDANRAEIMEAVPSFRIEGDRLFVEPKDHDALDRYIGESHSLKDVGERLPPSFYPGAKSDLALRVARAAESAGKREGLSEPEARAQGPDERDLNDAVRRTPDNKWRVHLEGAPDQAFDDRNDALRQARRLLFPYRDMLRDFADFIQGRDGDWNDAARDWVMQRGRETGHEHVAIFDPATGTVAQAGSSGEVDFVPIPEGALQPMADPAMTYTVHHNHRETALSAQDIAMLAAPGLRNVLAHTVGGAVSAARLTDSFARINGTNDGVGRQKLIQALYTAADDQVVHRVRALIDNGVIDWRQGNRLVRDLTPRVLQAAGVLDYVSSHGYGTVPGPLIKNIIRDAAGPTRWLLESRAKQVNPGWDKSETPLYGNALVDRSARTIQPGADVAGFLAPRGLVGPGRRFGDIGDRGGARHPETPGRTPGGSGGGAGGERGGGEPRGPRAGRQLRLPGLNEEPAQTAPEAAAGLERTAEAVADRMEKGPPPPDGTNPVRAMTPPARPPSENAPTRATLGAVSRLGIFARVLAGRDHLFAALYGSRKNYDHTFAATLHNWRERIPTFLKLARDDKAGKVYAAEELARHTGAEFANDGRNLVLRNEGTENLRFSKPGDAIKLNRTETTAFFERRDMFGKAWGDYRKAAAKKLGWDGAATSKAAYEAASQSTGSPRERKRLANIGDVLRGIEDHERRGYVPFMRFGDYYVHVTPRKGTDPESPGGFPETKWFELMETQKPKSTWFGKVEREGAVPADVPARLAELRKQFPADKFDIDHGSLTKKADVLRNVGIPAIEKLMIAMEGNVRRDVAQRVREGSMSKDEAAREKELWPKMSDALERQMFEELKAGYKKQANNVPGYSADWNRASGAYMHGTAANVAEMSHRDAIESAYQTLQNTHHDQAVKQYAKRWKENLEEPASPLSRLAGGASQMAFYWTLAANPSSAVIIALHSPQVAHSMLAMGMGKNGSLGAAEAGRELYGALFNGLKALRFDTAKGLHIDHGSLGRDASERAFIDSLAKTGELHAAGAEELGQMQAAQAKLFGPRWKQVLHVAGSNIAAADQLVRTSAALAAYRMAKREGGTERFAKAWGDNQLLREMIQKEGQTPETIAKFMLGQAAFDWGRANSIPLQRGGLGKIAFQFHQFQMRYLSSAWNLMAHGGPAGKAAAGLMMGNLWLLAGVNGLPFVQDAENGIDQAWKFFRGSDPMTDARMWSYLTDNGVSRAAAEMVRDGPASAMLGVKLSSRLGFGDVATRELHGLDLVGAAPSIMWNAFTGAKRRLDSKQGIEAAIAQAAPAAVRNPMRAAEIYPEQGVRSQTGKTRYLKPEDLSTGDRIAQGLGFTPQSVSRAYEKHEFDYRRQHAKGRVPHNPYVGPKE